jgi:hypothetical protein
MGDADARKKVKSVYQDVLVTARVLKNQFLLKREEEQKFFTGQGPAGRSKPLPLP